MIDRNKVDKGLECHINLLKDPDENYCEDCPYKVKNGMCESLVPLLEDALTIIRCDRVEMDLYRMGFSIP